MSRRFLTDKELEEILMQDSDHDDNSVLDKEFVESDDDISDAESEHSDHNTDSEEEVQESEQIDNVEVEDKDDSSSSDTSNSPGPSTSSSIRRFSCFYGKNRYKWAKIAPRPSVRIAATNIITHHPGLIGPARIAKPATPYEAWRLLFTNDILEKVLEHTNEKITNLSANYSSSNATFINHLSISELKAFLGLLYLAGVFKSGREDVTSLWATDGTGRDIFRATMPMRRFMFLLTVIRFDNADSRAQRIADGDKLAAISEIFKIFTANCSDNYACSEYATVDEMLVPFRGKCKFRMYMKSKPAKYGLKIMCLCDAKTHYLLNAFVYTGKNLARQNSNKKKLSIPTLDVLSLVSPIANTNRNVTGDNWFTSIELVNELKSLGLTYVGTIRKNKRDVPSQFQPNKDRKVGSSIFGFAGNRTLVSYVPKKNRSVILLSTMHHTDTVNDQSKKPEIIEFYNSTKSGVDSLDQKCASYSCNRRSRRWPLTIFYGLLNIAGVNSFIIYTAAANLKPIKNRREYNISLGKSLINDHLHERLNLNISNELKNLIRMILQVPISNQKNVPSPPAAKRQRCAFCPRCKDRKYPTTCSTCAKTVCREHGIQKMICISCNTDQIMASSDE